DFAIEVVDAGCSTEATVLVAPASGASLDSTKPVAFTWTSVSGATGYVVLVSNDAGATFTPVATADANTTTAAAKLEPGAYLALIRTLFGSGCSRRSQSTRFSVVAPPPVVCGTGTFATIA